MTDLEVLDTLEGKSGVYFVSNEYHTDDLFLVKVGVAHATTSGQSRKRTGGLRKRVESYLLCYPRGFYLFGVMKETYRGAGKLERKIQSYLTRKGRKATYGHSHIEEWYWMRTGDIQKLESLFKSRYGSEFFDPPVRIRSNITAGRQVKRVALKTPEKDIIEERTTRTPPSTHVRKHKKRYRVGTPIKLSLEILDD
jgi:hypothetical protein